MATIYILLKFLFDKKKLKEIYLRSKPGLKFTSGNGSFFK